MFTYLSEMERTLWGALSRKSVSVGLFEQGGASPSNVEGFSHKCLSFLSLDIMRSSQMRRMIRSPITNLFSVGLYLVKSRNFFGIE